MNWLSDMHSQWEAYKKYCFLYEAKGESVTSLRTLVKASSQSIWVSIRTNAVWEDRWSYSQSKQYFKCKAWWNAPFIQWTANQLVPQPLCPQQDGRDLSIFRPHSIPPPACSFDLCHFLSRVSVIYMTSYLLSGIESFLLPSTVFAALLHPF